MPQKLIRLTCESNDGVFDGLFDQDIHIKQDSEIAFQSLALERTSSSFNVNNSNKQMDFVAKDSASGIQRANIDVKLYEKEDRFELMQSIQDNLNKGCNMLTKNAIMNLQWCCEIDEDDDLVKIAVGASPFFPLGIYDTTAAAPLYNSSVTIDAPVQNNITDAETPTFGAPGIGRLTETVLGSLNESYIFSEMRFIQSTGSFRIKLAEMTAGTANRPAFTMGLVNGTGLTKLKNSTIELTDLVYAIQVDANSTNPAQGGYSYINTLGSAAVTATAPFVKIEKAGLATTETNDVMEIVMRNGVLQGLIHRDAGGLTTLPQSPYVGVGASLDDHLYPVLFLHLANTVGPLVNNLVHMIDCSLDPWFGGVSDPNEFWIDFKDDNPQLETQVSTLPTLVQYDDVQTAIPFEPQFGFASFDIAEYLGFSDTDLVNAGGPPYTGRGADLFIYPPQQRVDPISGNPYDRNPGYKLSAKSVLAAAVDGDSYLVDTQTFMLDSYDSYGLSASERNANAGGSRRNLLATIPVTETVIPNSVNSRVTYEPNTLDYIAIKNRSDIITRQIRMRLLDARYEPITNAGLAAMTILIRDP
jgi:hypothetical protein